MTVTRRAKLALNLIFSLALFISGAAALASADRWFAGADRTAPAPGGPALHVHAEADAAQDDGRPLFERPRPAKNGVPLGFFARLGLLIAVDLAAVSAMLAAVSRAVRDLRALWALRCAPLTRRSEALRSGALRSGALPLPSFAGGSPNRHPEDQ